VTAWISSSDPGAEHWPRTPHGLLSPTHFRLQRRHAAPFGRLKRLSVLG
jgi:hypothetical protein